MGLQTDILTAADALRNCVTSNLAKSDAVQRNLEEFGAHCEKLVHDAVSKAGADAAELIRKANAETLVDHRTVTIATPVERDTFGPKDVVALAMRVNDLDEPPDQLASLGDGHEFYDELMRRAQEAKLEGETVAQAFGKICATSAGKALLDANRKLARPNIAKAISRTQAVTVEKTDAYGRLEALATELQKRDPALTEAKAFAKVFADPANAALSTACLGR